MRTSKVFFTLLIGVLTATMAFGQMTKAEKKAFKQEMKEWKKKKKAMSPDDFKLLFEEHSKLKAENASMAGELESLEAQASAKDQQLSDQQKEITRMQAASQATMRELENLREQVKKPAYNPELINGEDFSIGVVFKVQVGAFRKMDIGKYAKQAKDFSQEEAQDLRKYVVGNFRNYEDANVLKRYLREMGVEDAWIVPYRDGKRVPLKDVLDSTAKTN
jgi:septal ring factor EnvC (AmiA/AmiB activator)